MTVTDPRQPVLLRLPLALAVVCVLGARPAAAEPPTASEKPAVVPFEMIASNHMVVSAKLNGKGPYRLIFDLGAPVTLISNRAAEESGTIKANAPRSFLFAMRGASEVSKLQVGDLTARKLPVIVFDHPLLKALGDLLGKPLDGIIGYTFFARYKTTIDYQTRTMTFVPVDHEVKDLFQELPERLAGPKVAERRILAPGALWGLTVGEAEGDAAPGVPVTAVLPDSPASSSGLKPGDVLTSLDGRWTTSVADTYAAAELVEPGRTVPVAILRDGREQTLTIKPAEGF